ncbi:MAG: aspartate-semialdehyde dehydrogenase, partial [Clostridia bacterium]|nr:aspartate-semialdehyde dehydrogenase [Clostridia bacterium]
MTKKQLSVGIVGATGLIGRKFVKTLEKRKFPVGDLRLFATKNSEGKIIHAFGKRFAVEKTDGNSFDGLDLVFFSAGRQAAEEYAPKAAKSGAVVIDNSSAFRMRPDVPLVIPEINIETALHANAKIISNPNCSTIQAILPLANLYKEYGLKRLIISTYQAVSGNGQKGVNDLTRCRMGKTPLFYPVDIAKNCICKIGDVTENGYTDEELKARDETRKILSMPVEVSATCVRVPVENCHGVNVEAEFEKQADINEVIARIYSTEGVKLKNLPFAEFADGKDEVFVGRIRKSTAFKNGVAYFAVADNELKGAALNAVQ